MSLVCWLPLTGTLENKGISNHKIALTDGNTWTSPGKIGNNALTLTKLQLIVPSTSCMSGAKEISYAYWVKVNTAWSANWLDGIRWIETDGSATSTARQEFYTDCTLIGTWYKGGSISGKAFTPGVWTHLAGTFNYNTGEAKFYINGVLSGSTTNVNTTYYCRGDFCIGDNGVDICENDVRIYDHCLSAAEVHEISQGLILHYKLDGTNSENTINYAPSPYKDSYSTITPGWDTSKHINAIAPNGWRNGYNGGVSEPTIGYHAMWNIIDNIPTLIFQNHNSIVGKQGRWMGTQSNTIAISIPAGTKYTISYEQRTIDTLGGYTTSGIYYKYNSSSNNGFHDTCPKIGQNTVLNQWERFSYTFTRNSNVDGTGTNGTIYIYGQYGTESTMQIRNIQLEIKDHMTDYIVNTRTGIIQDSSGYSHNGTITGNILLSSNTTRYSTSSLFNGTERINAETLGVDIRTLSCWCKTTKNKSTSQHMVADSFSQMCISFYKGTIIGVFGTTRSTGSKSTLGTSYKENDWNHIVVVKTDDAGARDIYCNGVKLTPTSNDYWSATTGFFVGARNNTNGNAFYGNISDVRAYCTALSAADIKQLYEVGAKVDNLQGLHIFEIKETNRNLLAGKVWTSSYSNHNPTSTPFTNFNSKGEYQFTTNSTSASSEYIPINPSGHTYEYDYTISVNTGNQFYIGFERYDKDKTARSNNACIYTYATKPSSDVIKQHFTGTVNLSTDGTNPCAFIALRILNGWNGTTSGVTGTATIHSFSLREIGTKQNPKLTKQGQLIEEELKEETNMKLHKNGIIETNNLIER